MYKKLIAALAPLALAGAIAGCGSSSSSTSASSAAAGTTSGSSAGGAYGTPPSSTTSATAAPTALIATKPAKKLGTVLAAGPKKLTVYLFEADKGGQSSCTGACAAAWPPVTGSPKATAGAMSADLGTITRSDGTKQVTYKGHPLYTFIKDKDSGDAYGQGAKAFGASWYALSPTGKKIDKS